MSDSTFGSVDQISSENIKHLVFRVEPEDVKYPPYKSRFTDAVKREYKEGRLCHQTMGVAHGMRLADPDDYLKKRSRVTYKAIVDQGSRTPKTTVPVPKREDWNYPAPRVEQNFILHNALKAVRSVPPMGPSREFDTALGRYVHNCNMEPRFTRHENFGRVPDYIMEIKQEYKQTREMHAQEEAAAAEQKEKRIKIIPPEEREALLQKLKLVWTELQKEFQLLPFLCDTPPKIKRKESLEARLREIEKDIKTVEENARIIVIQDPNDPACAQNQPPDPCFGRAAARRTGRQKTSLKAATQQRQKQNKSIELKRSGKKTDKASSTIVKIESQKSQPSGNPTTLENTEPKKVGSS